MRLNKQNIEHICYARIQYQKFAHKNCNTGKGTTENVAGAAYV